MNDRIRRTKEQWLELFQRQVESQLNNSAFCRQENINDKYYSKRKRELLDPPPSTDTGFIKLTKKQSSALHANNSISLQYQQSYMQIPLHTDPRWVASLLKSLS